MQRIHPQRGKIAKNSPSKGEKWEKSTLRKRIKVEIAKNSSLKGKNCKKLNLKARNCKEFTFEGKKYKKFTLKGWKMQRLHPWKLKIEKNSS